MGSLWSIAALSFTVALSGALMPGPLLVVTIAHSRKKGFLAGPLATLGHGLPEAAFVIAGVALLDTVKRHGDTIAAVVTVAGSALLVMMGVAMLAGSRKMSFLGDGGEQKGLAAKVAASPVAGGLLATLGNPYWLVWWATAGLAMVAAVESSGLPRLPALSVFAAAHISADLAWYSLVAFCISRGKNIISDGVYKAIIALCGIFLIGFGVFFAASSGNIAKAFKEQPKAEKSGLPRLFKGS